MRANGEVFESIWPELYPVSLINGEAYVEDLLEGEEPKKLWTYEQCKARVIQHLESLPTNKHEAREESTKWWLQIINWVRKEADKGTFQGSWAAECYERMFIAWEDVTGEKVWSSRER